MLDLRNKAKVELNKAKKKKVELGKLVRVLPGGKHALYESNVGIIRKSIVV